MEKCIMNLTEYKEAVSKFFDRVDAELMTDCEKNEIYIVDCWFRSDNYKDGIRYNSALVKTRDKINEIMGRAREDVPWELRDIFEETEEDIADYMWWAVEKYTFTDNDTMQFARVDYDIDGNIIDVCLEHDIPKQYEEMRDEYERLTFKRKSELSLDLDFQNGDIIQIDDMPYGESKYAVYADKEQIETSTKHNLIIIDEHDNVDIIDSLEMSFELATHSFPFAGAQKTTECPISKLNNIKTIVKNHLDVYKGIRFLWRAETDIFKKKWILNRILQNKE